MPRRPVSTPTLIYWLVDTRPETIANGWSNGYPFYCGKTIFTAQKRLTEHRHGAKQHPHRAIAAWIRGCGKHIRVQTMETVQADGDWSERERYWIATLRLLWPLCANTTLGGQGAPGLIHSRESIERRLATVQSRKPKPKPIPKPKHTPESKARIGAASKGRKHSAESIERGAAKRRGRKMIKRRKRKLRTPARSKPRLSSKRKNAIARAELVKQRQHVIEPKTGKYHLSVENTEPLKLF